MDIDVRHRSRFRMRKTPAGFLSSPDWEAGRVGRARVVLNGAVHHCTMPRVARAPLSWPFVPGWSLGSLKTHLRYELAGFLAPYPFNRFDAQNDPTSFWTLAVFFPAGM